METPENIRPSLQTGEWVMSIDFKDNKLRVQEILHFYIQNSILLVKGLTFGLSTAPMEFTLVVEEDELMAQNKSTGSTST